MAFYPQFPAFYAYPVPFPANQEFYAVYPHHNGLDHPASGNSGPVYYESNNNMPGSPINNNNANSHGHHVKFKTDKLGYNNRKESTDSGISDFSALSSRKTSSTSTISNASLMEEASSSSLEEVKEEAPFVEPDDDTCVQIVQQVEFYFSDANITKDKFLLKHVKRNKEGLVSLKLISSFKRVKHLTKDWRQVAYAIEKKSDKLEVNDLKTKVRRLDPLPEYDETTPSRTVVAMDLPLERPTIESVAEIFSACGDIVLVRILRPGNPIPADVRPFVNKHPEMTSIVCALVEFDRTEFALKAVRELNSDQEGKMKVMELTAPPPAKTSKKNDEKKKAAAMAKITGQPMMAMNPAMSAGLANQPQRRYSHAGMMMMASVHQSAQVQDSPPRRKISLFHNMKFSPIAEERSLKVGLNPNAPIFTMHQAQQHHHQHQQAAHPLLYPMHQRRLSKPSYLQPNIPLMPMMEPMVHAIPASSAWMNRRVSGNFEMASSGLALPPNVVRLPRGPDKGKGFQRWCKTRMTQGEAVSELSQPLRKPGSHAVPIIAPPDYEVHKEPQSHEEEEALVVHQTEEDPNIPTATAATATATATATADKPAAQVETVDKEDEDEGHYSDQEAAVGAELLEPSVESEKTR